MKTTTKTVKKAIKRLGKKLSKAGKPMYISTPLEQQSKASKN